MLTDADLAYIRTEFVPLAELCAAAGRDPAEVRAAIAERRRPGFPYPVEYLPGDYFELPDADEFRRTFRGPGVEEELEAYLDGTYFACVRQATVANIARKETLVTSIRARLDTPAPRDAAWLAALHELVDELDLLERPFSPDYDRARFGKPPTRDELIADVRARYPRLAA